MFGADNRNPTHPVFLNENHPQLENSTPNQLQLFQNLSTAGGCNVDPVNFFGNSEPNHGVPTTLRLNKRNWDLDCTTTTPLKHQKLRFSLNSDTIYRDEAFNHLGSVTNPNPVFTGLRLSYDDEDHNSSITSTSENLAMVTPIIPSLRSSIAAEICRQNDELDLYIKAQQEEMGKGMREIKERQTRRLVRVMEVGIRKKMEEKEVEMERMGCRNRELVEKVKQVGVEAQSWEHRARYSESVVNTLRASLQRAVSRGVVAAAGKEGFGDSEADDAASSRLIPCVVSKAGRVEETDDGGVKMTCRGCSSREVGVLLMPCRHLCLCLHCEDFFSACPICASVKSASIHVFFG